MDPIVTRGRLSDSRHIELSDPITELEGELELVIRRVNPREAIDVFDLLARTTGGQRSKTDIDEQIREQREEWNS
jgi:hypothetical protein